MTRVAREVGTDGKLGGQAVVLGVGGTWKDLTDNVNSMASNLTGQVRNIAEVTTAVANGDLSKKITVETGLCSNNIGSLFWDSAERKLWAGTNKGINCIGFSSSMEIQSVNYLGENEGLTNVEISRNCITKTNDKHLWF